MKNKILIMLTIIVSIRSYAQNNVSITLDKNANSIVPLHQTKSDHIFISGIANLTKHNNSFLITARHVVAEMILKIRARYSDRNRRLFFWIPDYRYSQVFLSNDEVVA